MFYEATINNISVSNDKNKEEESEDKEINESDNKYVIILVTLKSSKLIIERCQKYIKNEEKEISENI